MLPLIILTNCDEVELRYGALSKRIGPDRENYPHLPHPPVVLDHRHFTADELGTWGLEWIDSTFTGYIGGEPVASLTLAADPLPTTLEVVADSSTLKARERDSTRVIIRALDQRGQRLPFMNDSISLKVHGPARIVGPTNVPLQGGTAGFLAGGDGVHGRDHRRSGFDAFRAGVAQRDGCLAHNPENRNRFSERIMCKLKVLERP